MGNVNEGGFDPRSLVDVVLIDTGDIVEHKPTGETWTVACVEGGRLSWCGWPEGTAALSDCTLVAKASTDQKMKLLGDIAKMQGADHRKSYAIKALSQITNSDLNQA